MALPWNSARQVAAPLHVGPDGTVFRYVPGDEYVLRGQCPNRHGALLQTPAGQRCAHCSFTTNMAPAAR